MKNLSKKQWMLIGGGVALIITGIVFRKEIKAQYDKVIAKMKG